MPKSMERDRRQFLGGPDPAPIPAQIVRREQLPLDGGGQPEWHVRFVAPNLLAESRETCRIARAIAKAKGA